MTITLRISMFVAAIAMGAQVTAKPITTVVRLKAKVSMADLARQVSDPQSPRYGKFYTPQEIRNIAAPDEASYQATLNQLRAEGFQIIHESKTHLWVTVRGEASSYESVFAAQMMSTQQGFHRALLSARVPNRLGLIASVVGLDNTRHAEPRFQILGAKTAKTKGISQATIKKVYGFDDLYKAGLTGKGQDVAIATYDGFNMDDIKTFYKKSKLPATPNVDQVTFNGTPAYDENSAGETELDAEFTGMIAPGANIHIYASATNDDAGELQMFTAILDDDTSKIVNYSWGGCEPMVSSQHVDEMSRVYERAVAQGVNIMVASGDSGSDSCRDGSTKADWPAASPNVIAVGGTSLTATKDARVETGWSCEGYGCSGGGISDLFDLPAFQKNLEAPYVKRSYPDVAFNADPRTGEAIYLTYQGRAQYVVVGGTSMAAPQWSGLLALVGEARANAGKSTLGYLNPLIYGATETEKSVIFDDITSGNNGAYSADQGWDAVTGLGTPNASALVDFLMR